MFHKKPSWISEKPCLLTVLLLWITACIRFGLPETIYEEEINEDEIIISTTGKTSRELFDLIHSFTDTKITGVDIVELNPYHDNGSTASIAAKIMSTLIAMNLSQNQ